MKSKKTLLPTPTPTPRMIARLGTVEDLWINPEEIRFDSDGEVSDVSEIWSQYGDEVEPEVQPR